MLPRLISPTGSRTSAGLQGAQSSWTPWVLGRRKPPGDCLLLRLQGEVPRKKKSDLTSENLDSIWFNIWLNGIYSWCFFVLADLWSQPPSHRCWKYLGTIWTPGNILETWFYSVWCYEYYFYWYVVCFVLWRMSNKKWDSKQMHVGSNIKSYQG